MNVVSQLVEVAKVYSVSLERHLLFQPCGSAWPSDHVAIATLCQQSNPSVISTRSSIGLPRSIYGQLGHGWSLIRPVAQANHESFGTLVLVGKTL